MLLVLLLYYALALHCQWQLYPSSCLCFLINTLNTQNCKLFCSFSNIIKVKNFLTAQNLPAPWKKVKCQKIDYIQFVSSLRHFLLHTSTAKWNYAYWITFRLHHIKVYLLYDTLFCDVIEQQQDSKQDYPSNALAHSDS